MAIRHTHTTIMQPAVAAVSRRLACCHWQNVIVTRDLHDLMRPVACNSILTCGHRHPKAWWGADPWRLLSDLCSPGLCIIDAPAAIPESALATQPATGKPISQAQSAQENLNTQLSPQETTQQAGNETIHTCKLQASCLVQHGLAS